MKINVIPYDIIDNILSFMDTYNNYIFVVSNKEYYQNYYQIIKQDIIKSKKILLKIPRDIAKIFGDYKEMLKYPILKWKNCFLDDYKNITNRLRYLWNEGDINFSGNYGDALGNGPDFYIPGRGYSLHYYLFRLPINDAFCDTLSKQQTTIGPILNFDDIFNLYQLSCSYGDNYKNLYGIDRPNILDVYILYHEAIKKNIIDKKLQDDLLLSREDIENNKFISNKLAVDKLKII